MPSLLAVHPVLEVGDMAVAASWYREAMGFAVAFDDGGDPPGYLGLRRDRAEIHLQSHPEPGWAGGSRCVYRFMVDDPDALLVEFCERSALFSECVVTDTSWGTREFGQHDPDGNTLVFYRDS